MKSKDDISKSMRAIKSVSNVETVFAKKLYKVGIRYRRNNRDIQGKPDISIKKYKLAIFIDGEFWHGKDWEIQKNKIKSNRDYWIPKIEKNIQRDALTNRILEENEWKVFRFWSRDLSKRTDEYINLIKKYIQEYGRRNDKIH